MYVKLQSLLLVEWRQISKVIKMLIILYDRVLRRVDGLRGFPPHQVGEHFIVDIPAEIACDKLGYNTERVLVVARTRVGHLGQ